MERVRTAALVLIAVMAVLKVGGDLIEPAQAATSGVKCVAWGTDVTTLLATSGTLTVRDVEAAELQSRVAAMQAEGYRVPVFVDAEAADGKFEGVLCMAK